MDYRMKTSCLAHAQSLKHPTETNEDLTESRGKLYSGVKKICFFKINSSPKVVHKVSKIPHKTLVICEVLWFCLFGFGGTMEDSSK